MAEDTMLIIIGVIIAILVFVLGYRFLIIISYSSLKKSTLNEFVKLQSSVDFICSQESKSVQQVSLNLPDYVRAVYASTNTDVLPKITENIKNGKIGSGEYLCMQFKNEQNPRCQKVKCKVFMPYIGSLETWNDLKLLVNKILGKPMIKEYTINIYKRIYGVDISLEGYNSFKIPTMSVVFIPLNNDGSVDISSTGSWKERDKNVLITHIKHQSEKLAEAINHGSRYHWFKDSESTSSVNYYITDVKIIYEKLSTSNGYVDLESILTKIDVCNYVDNSYIKEIWLWVYDNVKPIEFITIMGDKSKESWNMDLDNDGEYDYGYIAQQCQILPICKNSYTVYNFGVTSSLGIILSNYSHRIETTLSYVDAYVWDIFTSSCGTPDCPPNLNWPTCLYNWDSEATVKSTCIDWNPDPNSAKTSDISCHTWYGRRCEKDDGFEYKIWWLQNLPGKNNKIVAYGSKVKNWWEFIGNFDEVIKDEGLM
ncbi:MAG: hypothetical protein N3E38_02955 [Candidatus Aenigmarchaeota archaeon]|nr:hypothetical protein [Candidatus Aenigmarchaeota archaeon]